MQVPPNGLVIYTATVLTDGGNLQSRMIYPPYIS